MPREAFTRPKTNLLLVCWWHVLVRVGCRWPLHAVLTLCVGLLAVEAFGDRDYGYPPTSRKVEARGEGVGMYSCHAWP